MRSAISYYYSNILKYSTDPFRKERDNIYSRNPSLLYNILRYIKSL